MNMLARAQEQGDLSRVSQLPVQSRGAAAPISVEGGAYPASPALREKLCLLDSGELHIRLGTRLEPDVMAYIQQLDLAGYAYTERNTDLQDLRRLYGHSVADRAASRTSVGSDRQNDVVELIRHAVHQDASDLYIVTADNKGYIRARINGSVETLDTIPAADSLELATSLYGSMCDQLSDPTFQKQKPQDARLKAQYLTEAGLYGARISTMPRTPGHSLVMRLLYNSANRPTSMSQMSYLEEQRPFFERLTTSKTGVFLFSGPTGSGKSTSLQVCCEELMRNANDHVHGITLEDPTEYKIEGWTQVPTPRDANHRADWITGIRAMMRHDPDMTMIGEMRDRESMEAVMEMCLTGHLSLSTLHANDAVACMQRIANKGVPRDLYADPGIIRGLVNQKLVPALCEDCRRPWSSEAYRFSKTVRYRIEHYCNTAGVFVAGDGCPKCRHGATGRMLVAECVETTHSNLSMFADHGRIAARRYMKKEQGFITRTDALIRAINAGRVCPIQGEHYVNTLDEDRELDNDAA